MKYLLFDHMGVLNQAIDDKGNINESIVKNLNQLVHHQGYEILFHSSNNLEGQLSLLKALQEASLKKGLTFPKVQGLAVCDLLSYGELSSEAPLILNQEGLKIAAFGIKKNGKACIREALSLLFNIQESERKQSIVFDDDLNHILQAQKEGYQTKAIGLEGLTLASALEQILQV